MPQLSMHSPLGDLTVSEEDLHLVSLDWGWSRDQTPTPLLRQTVARLQAYFSGEATPSFDDLPMQPSGTAYQKRVWSELKRIPPGQTRSYKDIAVQIASSPRSVGQANGANKLPILIPCHRVVGMAGLGGYSGAGGLETKKQLLRLEGCHV